MTAFPERWLNVYESTVGIPFKSREDADESRREEPRLGVIHLRPDGGLEWEEA